MKSGIYVIVNLVTLQKYVGQSIDIQKRWRGHWKEARTDRVDSRLYNAMRKYGRDAFAILTLELCPREKLNEREARWIAEFDSVTRGYNLVAGGGQCERTVSDETRRRMAEAQRGRPPLSDATRAKIAAAMTGRPCSEETRAKRSRSLIGRAFSVESRAKMSATRTGQPGHTTGKVIGPRSEASKAKQSAAMRGVKKTPEHREKLRVALAKARAVLAAQRQQEGAHGSDHLA